MSDEMLVG